jgi:uncharacterized protein YbjT (DUF2867 family)
MTGKFTIVKKSKAIPNKGYGLCYYPKFASFHLTVVFRFIGYNFTKLPLPILFLRKGHMPCEGTILVTGATGYIGGRLVPHLLGAGYRVRCLVRDSSRLQGRSWLENVDVRAGDVLRSETLSQALMGVTTAYYLVHSLAAGSNFTERDLTAARNFAAASRAAGVERIIYLGGLGEQEDMLSEHLRSRQQTGEALRSAGVPVTEFRAAVIIGSGSISFEMIRYLTERLPVMICPKWVYTRIQPIAVADVLEYLVAALKSTESIGRIIEIGGADVVTYSDMMLGYARLRGLKRIMVAVPVLTPRLSSYWVHFVTPVSAPVARPLIEGLRNEVIVRDDAARRLFPHIRPIDYLTSVKLALETVESGIVETSWSDALSTTQGDNPPVLLTEREGMIMERREKTLPASHQAVYGLFAGLGGKKGWLYMDWMWELRGLIDRLAGGAGMQRGRRDPIDLRTGDALDFWRVEDVIPGRLVRLRAEMKMPGKAWLQFEVKPREGGMSVFSLTAFFAPKGLAGLLYWYLLYPFHTMIFSGLCKKIAQQANCLKQH